MEICEIFDFPRFVVLDKKGQIRNTDLALLFYTKNPNYKYRFDFVVLDKKGQIRNTDLAFNR